MVTRARVCVCVSGRVGKVQYALPVHAATIILKFVPEGGSSHAHAQTRCPDWSATTRWALWHLARPKELLCLRDHEYFRQGYCGTTP